MPDLPDVLWVHPDFDPYYYGFYLEGLRRVLGRGRVRVALAPFSAAARQPNEARLSVRLVAEAGSVRRRITIEANDMLRFDPVSIEWADLVAKVNYEREASPESVRERVLPIGPGFGVNAWRGLDLARWSASVLLRTPTLAKRRKLLSLYASQRVSRVPESAYGPCRSDPDYLFFLAKAWQRYEDVNAPRARFHRVARAAPGATFEGGFVPESSGHHPALAGSLADRKYRIGDYLARTRRSALVFNTPAVHGCLGWKLGEFLALGKAIVSLPIRRELPAPLEHGVHLHYVPDDEDAMTEAVALIRRDAAYRMHLESNARAYYERWVAPEAAARRILAWAGFG